MPSTGGHARKGKNGVKEKRKTKTRIRKKKIKEDLVGSGGFSRPHYPLTNAFNKGNLYRFPYFREVL